MASYSVPIGADVGYFFSTLPTDATHVTFPVGTTFSSIGDIVLPKRSLIIDGMGVKLNLGTNSKGFTCVINTMTEAMMGTHYRYDIRNFSQIVGGVSAFDLKATLNSCVSNCELVNQTEAAFYSRFCLLLRLENILITNPRKKGVILTHGDWAGATPTNSQSNAAILNQVRVYCMVGTTNAFTILNSNGVNMTNCVSEGSPCDYDLYLSGTLNGNDKTTANNPVLKNFDANMFHIEHKTNKSSVFINMPSKCQVSLSNFYWNFTPSAPVIQIGIGQLNLSKIGWWTIYHKIESLIQSPRINVSYSHNELKRTSTVTNNNCGSFKLSNESWEGNTVLTPAYVTVSNPSI